MTRFAVIALGFLLAVLPAQYARSQTAVDNTARLTYSAWTRSCTWEPRPGKQVCFAIRTASLESGTVAAAAILAEWEDGRKIFKVLTPLGMRSAPGTRIAIDAQSPLLAPFAFCISEGCIADYEATPGLLSALQQGRNLVIQAINLDGGALSLAIPLAGFGDVQAKAPTEWSDVAQPLKTLLIRLFKLGGESIARLPEGRMTYSDWTRLCQKDATGKQICMTASQGHNVPGTPAVSAIVIQPEADKMILRVTVPLGMALKYGTRMSLDNNTPQQSSYGTCVGMGCVSDYEAPAELVAGMKKAQNLTVQAIDADDKPFTWSVPLAGFGKAFGEQCIHDAVVTITGTVGDNFFANKAGGWTIPIAHPRGTCANELSPIIVSPTRPPSACRRGANVTATITVDVNREIFDLVTQKALINLSCK